ncbi:hypothetical protein ACWKSP_40490 [Micromonosporaceae bacterium Da 78-11]
MTTTDSMTVRYHEAHHAGGGEFAAAVDRTAQLPELRDRPLPLALTRPLFVAEPDIRGFADDLLHVLDLLFSLPDRLFGGNLERFCQVLGVERSRAELMCRLGGGAPQSVGRADVYHDGTAFRLLEFGIGSELGGWNLGGELPRTMLRSSAKFAEFAAMNGLGYVDTGAHLVASLRLASVAAGLGDNPVVALLEAPGALDQWGGIWTVLRDSLRHLGVDFHVGDLTQVTERDGQVLVDGRRVDIVYRCFEAADLTGSGRGLDEFELLCRAHEERRVVLWTLMEANLYGEKGCLALLSDPRWGYGFSARERELIDRVLPWTRSLNDLGPAETQELIEYCRNHRTELILKPNSLYGGIGVVAGWEVESSTWWQELRRGVLNGAIVQRRVTPRPEPVYDPRIGEEVPYRALWGIFYTPQGYAGARCYMVPPSGSAVIGLASGKEVLSAGVFEYPVPRDVVDNPATGGPQMQISVGAETGR